VLDVIEVPLLEHQPKSYQVENWLLDPKSYWVRTDHIEWGELESFADDPAVLWLNSSSSYNGLNDRVSVGDSASLHCSLYLLYLETIKLRVFAPGAAFGNPKRRVQAQFHWKGANYNLWVTDPIIERTYLSEEDGEYDIGKCFLVISLGEAHDDGYCYKLVATIITPETE
jgi:hypothetical protein